MAVSKGQNKFLKIGLVLALILGSINLVFVVYSYVQLNELITDVNYLEDRIDVLVTDFNLLEDRVDIVEDELDKTWHHTEEFVLSQNNLEKGVTISGEKWRFSWEFISVPSLVQLTQNLRVYDSNGNFIEGLSLGELKTEKGVLYVNQGRGNYFIKIRGLDEFSISITVEDYS